MQKTLRLMLTILVVCTSFYVQAQNIEVTVKGIRSKKGTLLLGVFKDEESFRAEKPFKQIRLSKKDVKNGVLKAELQLHAGTYGISLLDDENNNDEMDYNFIRMPQEGFGFSNYFHSGFSRPSLEDFRFRLFKGKPKKIEIRIRYI